MIRITIEDLECIFERILEKLKTDGYSTIEVNSDYYKFIPANEWENYSSDNVLVGSLVDDYESLTALVADPERPCTYVDFDRLASILHAVSQENNPPLD